MLRIGTNTSTDHARNSVLTPDDQLQILQIVIREAIADIQATLGDPSALEKMSNEGHSEKSKEGGETRTIEQVREGLEAQIDYWLTRMEYEFVTPSDPQGRDCTRFGTVDECGEHRSTTISPQNSFQSFEQNPAVLEGSRTIFRRIFPGLRDLFNQEGGAILRSNIDSQYIQPAVTQRALYSETVPGRHTPTIYFGSGILEDWVVAQLFSREDLDTLMRDYFTVRIQALETERAQPSGEVSEYENINKNDTRSRFDYDAEIARYQAGLAALGN